MAACLVVLGGTACAQANAAATTTVLTNTGSAGSYTLTGTVSSAGTTAGGPTGQLTFTDQTSKATLGSAVLGTPTTALGNFVSTASQTISAPTSCTESLGQAVAVDADGDGKLDLVFALSQTCTGFGSITAGTVPIILIVPGNGNGTFGLGTEFGQSTGVATGIATGSFGSTFGHPGYVLVSTGSAGQITVLQDNYGNVGATAIPLPQATGAVAVGPSSAWVAVGTTSGVNFYNNAAGALSLANSVPVSGGAGVVASTKYGLAVGTCASASSGAVTILTGSTSSAMQVTGTFSLPGCVGGVAAAYFRGSSMNDLIVSYTGATGNAQFVLFPDDGSGHYTQGSAITGPYAQMTNITAADLNNDGKIDFAVTDTSNAMVSIYFGNGDGTFKTPMNVSVPAGPAWVVAGTFTKSTPGLSVSLAGGTYTVLQSAAAGTTAVASISGIPVPGGGTHQVVAAYGADANFAASTSAAVGLTASPIGTALALSANPVAIVSGASTTLTAKLAPSSFGILATDGDVITFTSGQQALGTGALAAGIATLSTSSLPVGSDAVTASFAGDTNFAASQASAVTVTVSATPAPQATVSPSSLTFTGVNIGTAGPVQMVSLSNPGNAALSIPSIVATGDFAETTTCGSSLAAGGSCLISVTFTPTVAGSRTGTLTITDTASGSPQSVALSGTGEGVGLTAASNSLSVSSQGGSASTVLSLSALSGFSGTANLTCSVTYTGTGSVVALPACSMSPAQVVVSGSASSTLTVQTTANTSYNVPLDGRRIALAGGLMCLVLCGGRRRRVQSLLVAVIALAGVSALVGCGGGSPSTPSGGTTIGSYSVKVTAASGSVTASTTVGLSVQ